MIIFRFDSGKMKYYFTLILLCLNFYSHAQTACAANNRYVDSVFSNVLITQNILFGSANPFNPFVNSQNLYLDFYEAQGDTAVARPLIIHAFGGGFLNGNRTSDDIPYWSQEYVERGYVFASIDYRLGFNPLDGGSIERAAYRCAQDYSAALRFLVENADLYRIDVDNIIVTGNSAGSIGALIVAFMRESDRPNSTFGTTLEPNNLGCFNCSGNNFNNNERVPIKACINLWGAVLDTTFIDFSADSTDYIPTISFHGDADAVVPYQSGSPYGLPFFPTVFGSESIHFRLNNEAIPNEFISFPGFPHEPEQDFPWVSDTIISKATSFLFPFIYGDSAIISSDLKICADSLVTITADVHPGSRYCWHIPGATFYNDSLNMVVASFNSSGLYKVYLTETDYKGIIKVDSIEIEVRTPPNSGLAVTGNDGLLNLELTNNEIFQADWQFGDGATSGLLNPTHQYLDTGLHTIQVTFQNEFCSTDTSYAILSNKCPEAAYTYEVIDSVLFLYNESTLSDNHFWVDFEGTVYRTDTFIYPLTSEASFPFILNASNSYCEDTIQEVLEVIFCAKAAATYFTSGLSVAFENESFNDFFYSWNFGDGNFSSLPNPTHVYDSAGVYNVSLIVTSIEACSDTLSFVLEVSDVSTSILDKHNFIQIYPNPTIGYIIIDDNVINDNQILELYNPLGQLIFSGNKYAISDILGLQGTGLYHLKIVINNQNYVHTILKL